MCSFRPKTANPGRGAGLLLAALLLAGSGGPAAASGSAGGPAFEPQSGILGPQWERGPAKLSLAPTLKLGSHANRLGAAFSLETHWQESSPSFSWLFNWLQAAWSYELTTLGIPGPGHQLFGALGLGLTLGQGSSQEGLPFPIGRRTHSVGLQYEAFADTLGTSQWSGALAYAWSKPERTVRVRFENDILAFLGKDEFRTGALEASLHLGRLPSVWGVGLGFLAWTGATPRPNELTRHDTYDLSERRGGNYSHGVLYGALFYRSFQLSIGWDAEAIRDRVQNGLHYLIDDGRVPPLDRADRFFLQLSCGPLHSLY